MRELELKARIDDPEALRERLRRTTFRLAFQGRLHDRVYDRPEGMLTERGEVLRVRTFSGEEGEEFVLGWKGPISVEQGFKSRVEHETAVADGAALCRILDALGYGVVRAIDREVEVWERDGTTVRLEQYPRMDLLAELEGEPDAIERVIPELGLPRERWTPHPLAWFVERYEERTGARASLRDEVLTRERRSR